MKIAVSCLKKYIDFQISIDELCFVLVKLGFEVDGVENVGYCGNGNIVVGRVLEKNKHPNADRLSVCKVDVGQENNLQIVCGATNFTVGDIVPVALPGAFLGGIELKKTVMRGIESDGMMCSAKELGISLDSSGLLILNDLSVKIGTKVDEIFADQCDSIIDLSITSNRGDCLNYIGIARELSAELGLKLTIPETEVYSCEKGDVRVENMSDNCDYYCGARISNLKVGESPSWIKDFLQKSGIRSINNVVDVTNFVLLERGQPLHAFDFNKIDGNCVFVRESVANERIKTLDCIDRTLPENVLIIADEKTPIAIAGIIGGELASIKNGTTEIFLESAHFGLDSIRKSTRKLSISTDSSYRYERFVDKTKCKECLFRAIDLLKLLHSEASCKEIVEFGNVDGEVCTVEITNDYIDRLIGCKVDLNLFISCLERLGFEVVHNKESLKVKVPDWRGDISNASDLVEEFLRLNGSDNLPTKIPDGPVSMVEQACVNHIRNEHADFLSCNGFYECYNDSFCKKSICEFVNSKDQVESLTVINPINCEYECLRPSLIPGLLSSLKFNRDHGNNSERFFESGRIFRLKNDGSVSEYFSTAFIYSNFEEKTWKQNNKVGFYEAKTMILALLNAAGFNSVQMKDTASALWQKGYSGGLGMIEQIGVEANVGFLNLNFTQNWFKEEIILGAECVFDLFKIRIKGKKKFKQYYEWPKIRKDLSLLVPTDVSCETVRYDIEKILKKLIKNPVKISEIKMFDVFSNDNKKSFAFAIIFESNIGTLTDEVVNEIFENLQTSLEATTKYKIRKQNK